MILGYFDPENNFLVNENKQFSEPTPSFLSTHLGAPVPQVSSGAFERYRTASVLLFSKLN